MEFIYSLEMINGTFMPVRKEEIIRCKDCKHFDGECCMSDDVRNMCIGDDTIPYPDPDFFCKYGEKKEEI